MGNIEKFSSDLRRLVEKTILMNGWCEAENTMKIIFKRDKHFQRFKNAFNEAVLVTFHEWIIEVLNEKVRTKWDELQVSVSNDQYAHRPTRKSVVEHTRNIRINFKVWQKDKMKQLIDNEYESIKEIKQRLNFQMAIISETKTSLSELFQKCDKIIGAITEIKFDYI